MEKRFHQWIAKRKLFSKDQHVLVALSGGVDSVVLTHLLVHLPLENRPQLYLAHVNHHLRQESDEEQRFVKEWAMALELPLFIFEWHKEEHPHSNIENAAREMRYHFFDQIMMTQHLDTLLTAHHQDDQVETILMRLFSGKNIELLTGISEVSSRQGYRIVRPLLPFKKEEIYAYAAQHGLTYFEDATNFEPIYFRNMIRTKVMPSLKDENPKLNEHIERFKQELHQLLTLRDYQLSQLATLKEEKEEYIHIKGQKLKTYPVAIQQTFIESVLKSCYENDPSHLKNNYTQLVWQHFHKGSVNSELHLARDLYIYKTYNDLYFCKGASFLEQFSEQHTRVQSLDIGQWITLSPNEKLGLFKEGSFVIPPEAKVIAIPNGLHFPLVARHRKPGDRMQVKGMAGTKKIKKILIDDKVPKHLRDKKWIISDQTDKIIWLVGIRKADLNMIQNNCDRAQLQLVYINNADD
ncbi:tRNA lysidine(34) synthetase TilS [Allofustis seminis]|uniref:tRNA lysidine(34) synthetase TilS n=1 Tax=Allofustis seminis TaxID=166939 RepID=UPI00035CEDE7|nr:tRNA lysidine(34) synthetase TilS [Allofustis seminis]